MVFELICNCAILWGMGAFRQREKNRVCFAADCDNFMNGGTKGADNE